MTRVIVVSGVVVESAFSSLADVRTAMSDTGGRSAAPDHAVGRGCETELRNTGEGGSIRNLPGMSRHLLVEMTGQVRSRNCLSSWGA